MGVHTVRETQSIAAIFPDEEHARMAMRELDELGFKRSWMGVVRAGENFEHLPIVDSADGGGVFEALGRMFGGEGDRSLHAVLTSHGVPSEQALKLVEQVQSGNAVITLEVEDVPNRAIETLEAHGGDVGKHQTARNDRRARVTDSADVFL